MILMARWAAAILAILAGLSFGTVGRAKGVAVEMATGTLTKSLLPSLSTVWWRKAAKLTLTNVISGESRETLPSRFAVGSGMASSAIAAGLMLASAFNPIKEPEKQTAIKSIRPAMASGRW